MASFKVREDLPTRRRRSKLTARLSFLVHLLLYIILCLLWLFSRYLLFWMKYKYMVTDSEKHGVDSCRHASFFVIRSLAFLSVDAAVLLDADQ